MSSIRLIHTAAKAQAQAQAPAGAEILAQIAAGLSETEDLRARLERFLQPIVSLAGASAGAVRLLSESGEQLNLVSDIGLPAAVHRIEESVPRHCGVCGTAADSGRPVWASDLGACAARGGGAYFGQDCRHMLALPLQRRGRVLGIYNLFFATEAQPGPQIMALLRSVGELLGLALDNARLENENLRATVLQERQAMAAEVHDSIAQTLTFVKMRLPLLQDAVLGHDEPHALKYLADVRQAVGEAHASLREIVTDYRTRIGPRGLANALARLVARFRERTPIELEYIRRGPALQLAGDVQAEVFHIVQEALANVERHSLARHAWLTVTGRPSAYELLIEDDGIGPADCEVRRAEGSHHGIGIMGERARRMGGALSIVKRPGGGTCVRFVYPAPCGADGGATGMKPQ